MLLAWSARLLLAYGSSQRDVAPSTGAEADSPPQADSRSGGSHARQNSYVRNVHLLPESASSRGIMACGSSGCCTCCAVADKWLLSRQGQAVATRTSACCLNAVSCCLVDPNPRDGMCIGCPACCCLGAFRCLLAVNQQPAADSSVSDSNRSSSFGVLGLDQDIASLHPGGRLDRMFSHTERKRRLAAPLPVMGTSLGPDG